MTGIDLVTKLTSRKLWMAIAGLASGLIIAFGGSQETATQVTGLIMAAASVVGYIIGEGLIDAASAQAPGAPQIVITDHKEQETETDE